MTRTNRQSTSSGRTVANRYQRELVLLLALLFSGPLSSAFAAEASSAATLVTVGDTAAFSDGTYASSAHAIQFDVRGLAALSIDQEFLLQLTSGAVYSMKVNDIGRFLNGEQSLQARGTNNSLSLLLTYSSETLFGYLDDGSEKRQIFAREVGDGFAGWLYKPAAMGMVGEFFGNDYLIPHRNNHNLVYPENNAKSILPFQTEGQEGVFSSDSAEATTAEIDDSNFQIEQLIEQDTLVAGKPINATITFTNSSQEQHSKLSVEFYFLLENTSLLSAPANCSEQLSLSLQAVLYCELGSFAVGESKTLSWSVQTDERSIPNVYSTAIVGGLRDDAIINVVRNVRLDSDNDGISDFNEELLGTDPADASSVDARNTVIDVMALYTGAADDLYGGGAETRINQLIGVANQVYADSGVAITLRPVFYDRVSYDASVDMDVALDALINKSDPAFGDIDRLRQRYGADLVMLFGPLEQSAERCGLAPVGGYKTDGYFDIERERNYAYSYIAIDCPVDFVIAHELGHNMGLTHSYVEDGRGGTFDFATGHGVYGEFVTVMAYSGAFATDTRLPLFSSPDLDCLGHACGIAAGEPGAADAVRALNLVRHQIASYFEATVPELPTFTVTGTRGGSVDASVAMAVSTDGGLSFSDQASPRQVLDVIADVIVDREHVGQQGSLHVLVGVAGLGYVQMNALGRMVEWDGSVEGLTSASTIDRLRQQERLTILRDINLPQSLVGEQIAIYVGYQLADTHEIVYTQQPLLLNVVAD